MEFSKLYNKSTAPAMSEAERRKTSILIVESDPQLRQQMRQSLTGLGFENVADCPDHALALAKLEERPITHVFFEAKKTKITPSEFLRKALEMDSELVAIPTSYEPTIDDVFDLLIMGARGYVVKPFTGESLDDAVVMATKGEPLSDAILNARNRNEALASLVLSGVDRLATILRQSKQFDTAKHEIPAKVLGLKRSVDIARTFAKGGPLNLRETLIELLIERSEGPATRLGRYRKRMQMNKKKPLKSKEENTGENEENTASSAEMK